jgi:hypothetical protein
MCDPHFQFGIQNERNLRDVNMIIITPTPFQNYLLSSPLYFVFIFHFFREGQMMQVNAEISNKEIDLDFDVANFIFTRFRTFGILIFCQNLKFLDPRCRSQNGDANIF